MTAKINGTGHFKRQQYNSNKFIMNLKRFSLVLAAAMVSAAALAQQSKSDPSVEFRPQWSMQLQGGAAYTLGEAAFGDLLSPAAFINAEYRFIPALSMRIGVGGWQGKGSQVVTNTIYSYKFGQGNIDLKLDLCNLFGGFNHKRVCNVYILGGVGGMYGFRNGANSVSPAPEYIWTRKFFIPGRMGTGIDFRLGNRISLGIEGNANVMSDRFNSKRAGNADWQFNLLAGLTVHFGKNHKASKAYLAAQEEAKAAEAAAAAAEAQRIAAEKAKAEEEAAIKAAQKAEAEREAAEKAEAQTKAAEHAKAAQEHSDNIWFTIGSAKIRKEEAAKLEELAKWLVENPDFSVAVVGYADQETGNSNVNMQLSESRATNVKDVLMKNGVAEGRIATDHKGDTVQPFEKAQQNRVVICTVE